MGLFDGKVAIVTGAGRGIGRAEALLLASEGAAVVVNDLGGAADGAGVGCRRPAQQVVDEIVAAGGAARRQHRRASRRWADAEALVEQAVDTFGGLDVVINNAGILRDKMSFNMDEAEWDVVIDVHLKGHFCRRPPRRRLLAGEGEGDRRAGRRRDRQHRERVGPLRQRRAGQLRRGQGRHRVDDDRAGPRARAHRRAGQLHRSGGPHPPHRGGSPATS